MDCNVVRDLIPLYIEQCCSDESAALVREHLERCPGCRALTERLNTPAQAAPVVPFPKKLRRVNDWKASVLQSVLMFVSFVLLTVGVALEAATPTGQGNGYWALTLIIPATGFLLSLANWYFVRLYKSKKYFSNCSLLATLGITLAAYLWAGLHYAFHMTALFQYAGLILAVVFCVLSKLLSGKYAALLGKE